MPDRLGARRRHRFRRRAHRIEQDATDGQIAVTLVGPLDHIPRRRRRRRFAQQRLPQWIGFAIGVVRLPVVARRAPGKARVAFDRLQASFLLGLGQVDPELEQHQPFVAQHLLVLADRLQMRLEPIVVDAAVHPRPHRLVVPGVHEYPDPAARRQRLPIAPRAGVDRFLGRALAERDHLDVARIHPCRQRVGRLAAAGAVDAGNDDQHRSPPDARQLELREQQRFPEPGLLPRIHIFRDAMADLRRFEHRRPLSARTAWLWRIVARTWAGVRARGRASPRSSRGRCPPRAQARRHRGRARAARR